MHVILLALSIFVYTLEGSEGRILASENNCGTVKSALACQGWTLKESATHGSAQSKSSTYMRICLRYAIP